MGLYRKLERNAMKPCGKEICCGVSFVAGNVKIGRYLQVKYQRWATCCLAIAKVIAIERVVSNQRCS